ncbi:MAG: gamma-glutamyltransferase, partial [Marinomonas sp.]
MRKLFLSTLALAVVSASPAAAEDTKPAAEAPTLAIGAGGRPVGESWSRSPVHAQHGMAATAHPLASQVAIDILKKGGSAVDAAIAANAALGLMEPTGNGIGGDLFAIIWDPKTQKLYGLNGSGKSPMGTSYAQFVEQLGESKSIPPFGPMPVTVPGTVDAWFEMHGKFGQLSMADILAPTITYAKEGHPVSPVIGYYLTRNLKRFEENLEMIGDFDNARETYFKNGPTAAGQIFKNPDLGQTLDKIAKGGRDAFYKGEIAHVMDDYFRRIGGNLRHADFAAHSSKWIEPGCVDYRKGYELCELPPNSQGFAALQMANILKNVDLAQWPRGSAEVLHYITEAKRL